MSRIRKQIVDFAQLKRQNTAPIIIKLMMVCNDLSLVNESLVHWQADQPRMQKHRQRGAVIYFARIELSHLYEGLKVVEEIKNSPELMALLSRCDAKTQASFHDLQRVLPKGTERKKLDKVVRDIRNILTFHYDKRGKHIEKAITERASRTQTQYSSITRGSTAHLWRFEVVDDIVDSIVVRQLWSIPKQSDTRTEADNITDYVYQITLSFLNFAGEFIWKYLSRE
jgi:hypothetical protein